jgi:LuxR family transcriptional regulator, maltose regulon positive regulatory protein
MNLDRAKSRLRQRAQAAGAEPPDYAFSPVRTRAVGKLLSRGRLTSKIAALIAPVGYGKSVTMAMVSNELQGAGMQCLWIGLDNRDDTLDRLLSRLQAALDGPGAKLHPTQALFAGHSPTQLRIDALIARFNRRQLPLVLLVDNLQYCADASLRGLLDGLVFRTYSSLQLVVSSTHELPMDLSAARLQGLMTTLVGGDLSLIDAEVSELLGPKLCRCLDSDGIRQLSLLTEGWPAAVRMAQIILASAERPRDALRTLADSDRVLAQLLNDRVLSTFPPELRRFLAELALLHTFCAELCRYVTGDSQSAVHVAYLVDHNVFVTPLDQNRTWYRFHGLFREHLLHTAATTVAAERRRELLRRAARWCESKGRLHDAIDYALESGSTPLASQILAATAPTLVRDRGDARQLVRWIEMLHGRGAYAGHEAEYWFAWALAFDRQYDYARRQMAMLAARVRRSRSRSRRAVPVTVELERRIAILRASVDCLTDHLEAARDGASNWLAGTVAGRDDPFNLAAAHCIECAYFANAARYDDAQQSLQSAHTMAFQARSAYANGWVASYGALIACYEGDYSAGYSNVVTALELARAALGDDAGICGTIALFGSRCAVGMGMVDDALRLLTFGLKSLRTHGFLEAAACGLDAALLIWDGQSDGPIDVDELRQLTSAYPPRLEFMFACMLARRLLRLGRIAEATECAARLGLKANTFGYRLRATRFIRSVQVQSLLATLRIELLIACGNPGLARKLLTAEYRRCKLHGSQGRLVELALDSALIALTTGNEQFAFRQVTRAVQIAAVRQIVQPFLERAAQLTPMIIARRDNAWGFISEAERRLFADLKVRLQALHGRSLHAHLTRSDQPRAKKPLTPREGELLRYISSGLSNLQIADRIEASIATVKWHMQNLFAKLDVTSRLAAAARARDTGALEPSSGSLLNSPTGN